MAQVTYRGVSYDTSRHEPATPKTHELTYRGVKQVKEVK